MAVHAVSELRSMTLADGSNLDYFVGASGPDLLIYHHGTPAAGPIGHDIIEAADAQGFTVVEVVRPGYGSSTRQPGRSVVDVVPLVTQLVDHLGAERFVTMGWSGGGPHALATVARLPARCMAAMCLASVAPYDVSDLDFLAGMGEDNIAEFGAALAGPAALETFLTGAREELREVTGDQVVEAMQSLLPQADRHYLTGAFAEEMAAELRWALSTGIWGWFDDDIAFCNPWGFALSEISRPVEMWQGSDDLMVPFAHGQWLVSHVPGSVAQLRSGEGHLSLAAKGLEPGFAALRASLN